jgi:hypothetical protein
LQNPLPYCHLWPAPLYHIFPSLPHERQDFRKKKSFEQKCVSILSTTLFRNIFILRRSNQDTITRYSCPILMKLEFSRQIFEKYLYIKLYDNPSSGSQVADRLTDGRTDMAKLTVPSFQFCESA